MDVRAGGNHHLLHDSVSDVAKAFAQLYNA